LGRLEEKAWMKVRFTELSIYKLERLNEYLVNKWSEKVAKDFILKLDSSLERIKLSPNSYPTYENDFRIRKCLVTSQTSIYFQVEGDVLYVINLVDNRQDPEKIAKEIKAQF
jgi:plasmid stabilization system protein ParE